MMKCKPIHFNFKVALALVTSTHIRQAQNTSEETTLETSAHVFPRNLDFGTIYINLAGME